MLLFLLAMVALAACAIDPRSVPTPTPDSDLELTAAALLPTVVPTAAPTPTRVAEGDDGEQIAALVNDMALFIQVMAVDNYLALIDLSDPVFATEHRNFVHDWQLNPVSPANLELRNLTVDGDEATAYVSITWTVIREEVSSGADYPVVFRRSENGAWRYAGEQWATFEDDEHFLLRIVPGMEALSAEYLSYLPAVHDQVTASLDRVPEGRQEVKIYETAWDLVAATRFSLSVDYPLYRWNAPGEAIKLVASGDPDEEFRSTQAVLAHEYTLSVLYGISETARDQIPWWLSSGVAEYVASDFWTLTRRNQMMGMVREWQADESLFSWDSLASFEAASFELSPYACAQGYAFARYVTETYGQETRNTWLARMGTDLNLADATREVLGLSFSELDQGFRAWLEDGE